MNNDRPLRQNDASTDQEFALYINFSPYAVLDDATNHGCLSPGLNQDRICISTSYLCNVEKGKTDLRHARACAERQMIAFARRCSPSKMDIHTFGRTAVRICTQDRTGTGHALAQLEENQEHRPFMLP
jgi:hypothetical protein